MAETPQWAYLDHPAPIAFAHRGGAKVGPENTLAAFDAAVRLGYRYLETDARITADGVVVAFHDERVGRVAGEDGRICDLTWRELQELRIGGEGVPLMEEVLAAFPGVRVNIDAKNDWVLRPLLGVVERAKAWDRVCLGAFSDRRVAAIRRLTRGRVCTTMSPGEVARLRVGRVAASAVRAGACAQVPYRVGRLQVLDTRVVGRVHDAGLHVHVWTVDDPDDMHRLLDMGVDGIMTDDPHALKDVLVGRDQWVPGPHT